MRFHDLFRFSLFPLMALAASAGPLDELMPVPVAVEARAGFVEAAACTKVSVRVAAVPGAPSATADEAYVLDVAPDGVSIVAPTARGERWARVTLDQLKRLSGGRVPCCRITDWPHFKWRGFMHDSGRNFLEVEHVKGIIDAMSRCKMNLFHWHFTEYYGWRLESKRFPELQRPGAFYLRYIGKYYTQDEFREVVDYAAARGVTVMPEFDIPGHAFAFRRAFGFETMRDDGVREKLCALVDELCSLVPREKMPFIHLGTDEARLPEEKVPPLWMAPIIARVHANGRTVVGWTPGELAGLTEGGGVVGMRWGRPKAVDTTGVIPFLDASQMYLDTLDPFEIPAVATYRRVCPWNESEGERLGAVTCAWHDDFAGTGFRTLVNQAILPAFVLFGDAYWRGRDEESTRTGGGRIIPRGGDPRLEKLADIERRTAAQRDRVWADSPYPFHFLRQSDMRWRVSLADGTLLATNVAQATVFLWQNALAGMEDGKVKSLGGNLTTNRMGTAILETWIHAPSNIACGAWIGFTDFTRDHGRARSAPTPDVGQWNRFGATVEINGEQVPPPKWRKPGQQSGADVPHLKYVHELDEIAFEDEEYYMREPTPIKLVKGWNHVKLTVPMRKKAGNHAPWVGTFIPLLGTTAHPREVPGLAYSDHFSNAFALEKGGSATREILSWKGAGLAAWNRVSQARDLACSDSGVTFVTTGSDSQLYCGKCDFVSSASQFLRFRVRSTAGGKVEVFWAAADAPNLSQKKSASFEMIGDGAWHDYELRPFWPSGKRIVKLRFDPPQTSPKGTRVDISEIAILENPDGAGPIDTAKFPGVMFRYTTSEKRYSTLVWTTDASETMCRHEFRPVPDGKEHVYWFDLSLGVNGGIGYWYKKEWKGTASWFGVMDMRRGKALDVKDLRFVSEPPHLPADVEVESALPADGIVRVGYRSGIELVLRNLGTVPARNVVFELDSASSGLAFAGKTFPLGRVPASIGYDSVGGRLPNELVATVPFEAKHVGRQVVRGKISYASERGGAAGVRAVPVECVVEVLPPLGLPKADYVPEPKPIATRCEVGAISFPGWREHSWDRIRNFTPERKPLLGWYDEGNPEAVDWQIKWLVENGISYLLVDWFPRKEYVTERFHIRLNHWFEAFRKARYRRFLKFAVLWENQMKGHDVAFVEWVARYLADEFFSMPEYYRIDGRPVVYVWNKTRLDTELSAAGGCRKALEIIEAAAKAKGHKGVWFIAHRSPAVSRDEIESIRAAGFDMTAIYRYRGEGAPGVSNLVEGRRPFAEVEKTSLQHWCALQKIGILPFLPSLTTGWDDRPWNGDHGFEIYGRTVAAFEAICRDALAFSAESGVKNMLVGPINEWGEGSYAEPNAEFGFGMYEAIRNTFGIKPAEGWPINFTPKDVGLGPYPALPIPKVEDKMWPMSTGGDIIVESKGDLADQLNLLKQYRLTGERMILDVVRATQCVLATNVASDVRGSVHWLRLNRELFLLTGEVRYIDAIASACCGRRAAGDDAKRRFAKVADLTVTRNVDHALFVNFYPDATIEMDGVTFAISRENSSIGRVKVTTRSTLPRNLRFRIPGKGTEPSKYMNRCIKAGTDTIVLPFET